MVAVTTTPIPVLSEQLMYAPAVVGPSLLDTLIFGFAVALPIGVICGAITILFADFWRAEPLEEHQEEPARPRGYRRPPRKNTLDQLREFTLGHQVHEPQPTAATMEAHR